MTQQPPCAAPTCRGRHHLADCAEADCRGCAPRPAADGLSLCGVHRDRIGSDARDLAELHGELALRLVGGQGLGDKVSGTPGARLPDQRAVDARTEIRAVLVSWAKMIAEERGFSLPVDDVTAVADYVARYADWLAAHEAAGEASGELESLRRRARGVAYPSGIRRVLVRLPDGTVAGCWAADCPGVMTAVVDSKACLADRKEHEFPAALICDVDDQHQVPSSDWHRYARDMRARAA